MWSIYIILCKRNKSVKQKKLWKITDVDRSDNIDRLQKKDGAIKCVTLDIEENSALSKQ